MSYSIDPVQIDKDGKEAYQRGDYLEAAHLFQSVADIFASQGDKLSEAEALNNCGVAFLRNGNAQKALEVIQGTPEVFSSSGDIRRYGLALGNLGDALEANGNKNDAAVMYEESAEMLEQAGEDEMRAHVLQSLSKLQLKSGRQIEALATMEAGIAGFKKPSIKQRVLQKLLRLPFKFMRS